MNFWVQPSTANNGVDFGVLEEAALAMAQSTIQNAINESGISKADLARKMQCNRSLVSRMLSGSHNLTIKTMARSLAACGFEIRFHPIRIAWNWVEEAAPPQVEESTPPKKEVPPNGGTNAFADFVSNLLVPVFVYA